MFPASQALLGDNIAIMKQYPNKYFDLAVCDPPYGMGMGKRIAEIHTNNKYSVKEWDNSIPDEVYFSELFRISKNQIIFGGNYFTDYLPQSTHWIVWDKENDYGNVCFSHCELMWTSFKKYNSVRIFRHQQNGFRIKNKEDAGVNRFHPTQKPIAIYSYLLNKYAKNGHRILDPNMGSGASRIAAFRLGFDYVGIELDVEYFNKQERRFEAEKNRT